MVINHKPKNIFLCALWGCTVLPKLLSLVEEKLKKIIFISTKYRIENFVIFDEDVGGHSFGSQRFKIRFFQCFL